MKFIWYSKKFIIHVHINNSGGLYDKNLVSLRMNSNAYPTSTFVPKLNHTILPEWNWTALVCNRMTLFKRLLHKLKMLSWPCQPIVKQKKLRAFKLGKHIRHFLYSCTSKIYKLYNFSKLGHPTLMSCNFTARWTREW